MCYTHRALSNSFHHRPGQAAIAGALFLLQVNLLWVAALHHHAEFDVLPRTASAMQAGNRQAAPATESGVLCTACQIARHGAARPAATASAPEPEAAVFLGVVARPIHFHARQPKAICGRAPPLA
ncbi:MAG: hypothetical protein ACLQOO_35625 [Terriglobia bacterium]